MPFSNDIIDVLLAHEGHEDMSSTKRELLVSFVMSQIDDKTVRLDLKRPNVNFMFEDIKSLAKKGLLLF